MAAPETFDGFDDVFTIDDDWDMALDTNEPLQMDGVPAEPTVEDGDLATEQGGTAATRGHGTRVLVCAEVTQRHGTSGRSCPQCRGARRWWSARNGMSVQRTCTEDRSRKQPGQDHRLQYTSTTDYKWTCSWCS